MIEKKYLETEVLDVDETKKKVKVAVASCSEVDRDTDLFDDAAFNRTIKNNGPTGANEIWHLLDHGGNPFGGGSIRESALSKPEEIFMENRKMVFVSPYRDTFNWREVAWPLYTGKDITQHSLGFITIKSHEEIINGKTVRVITEARALEGSAVLWGANANTPTLQVIKSFIEAKNRKEPIGDKFKRLCKAIKDGEYNDENASLLKLEFKYLEEYILELEAKAQKDTPPADDATDPSKAEAKEFQSLILEIQSLNNRFATN